MTNTTHYIALHPTLIEKHHLTPTLAVIYSALIDRLRSSRRHGRQYYDATRQAYFVNYSQPEMAANYCISVSTAQRAYNQLEKLGLLVKRHRRNASDCLYLPEFEGWWYRGTFKLTRPDLSICPAKHLTLTHSFKSTTETLNTCQTVKRADAGHSQPTSTPRPSQPTSSVTATAPAPVVPTTPARQATDQVVTQLTFSNLTRSLMTQGGIPADAANLMAVLSYQNHATLHEMARVVYQAKAAVGRLAEKACGTRGYESARWEHNSFMATDFKAAVARIIPAAYRRNRQHWQGFAYVAFVRFFEEVTNAWLQAGRSTQNRLIVSG